MELKAWPKTSTEQCVDILYEAYHKLRKLKVRVDRIVVDEPGVGGGVIDTAVRHDLPITPYNGGITMKKDIDPDEDIRMFANKRTRDWWTLRRLLEVEAISIPADEMLTAQMASVHYDYNERDRILVESKRKMRERLGDDASPDRADAVVMAIAPWTSMADPGAGIIIHDGDVIEGDERPIYADPADMLL